MAKFRFIGPDLDPNIMNIQIQKHVGTTQACSSVKVVLQNVSLPKFHIVSFFLFF